MRKRIIILGDVHDQQDRLATVLEWLTGEHASLALLTGDIGLDPPWSSHERRLQRQEHDDSVRRVIHQVRSALTCPVLFVPGNHDLEDPPFDVDGTNTDRLVLDFDGLLVAGFGGSGPAKFGFPYEWSDRAADGALEELFSQKHGPIDVFLCHAPPVGTRLDRTVRGEHVGSRAVAHWITRVHPKLFVCGHIHESPGLEWLDRVPCLNAGALGEPYGQEIAWTVDWDGGPARVESLRRGSTGEVTRQVWHPGGQPQG